MKSLLLASPILLPLATSLACALASSGRARRWLGFAGAAALLLATVALVWLVGQEGAQRVALGGWDAPYGIELVLDAVSAPMTLITAVVLLCALLYGESDADPPPRSGELHPLLFALIAGVGGTFVTGDLFNLYVWFEVMLLSALGLLARGGDRASLDASMKYFVLNAVGTIVFLVGIGLVYAGTGHLNYGALADAASREGAERWLPFVSLLTVAFLVKAGAFPVFAWLPASNPALPAPLLALFAGLLTKVGVFALLRTHGSVFAAAPSLIFEAVGWLGAASMIVGALGAIYHYDMRRILSFHIVSQVGYMLFGIALATEEAGVATLYYVIHHIAAKSNLFLLAGVIAAISGSYDLRRCGGLYASRPGLALLFLVAALSMVGMPPLSGFWAKWMLLREGVQGGRVVWTSAALLTGFLTLVSMMKIWFEAFLREAPEGARPEVSQRRLGPAYGSIAAFASITIALGLAPEPVLRFLEGASR